MRSIDNISHLKLTEVNLRPDLLDWLVRNAFAEWTVGEFINRRHHITLVAREHIDEDINKFLKG